MTTHNADGKELFVCGACKCRHTADEFDLDRHGIQRKCCIPCRVKREARKCENTALVCAAQRTCQDCGSNHRNRKDNICTFGGASLRVILGGKLYKEKTLDVVQDFNAR